jgi:hypothetical protein
LLAPEAFIHQVAETLQSVPVIGPGVLHRVIADAQRQHFEPPRFATALSAPRWSR